MEKQNNYQNLYNTSVIEQNMKDKRYENYREEWKNNPTNFVVADFPLNVDIEVTNACNLKCPHCARTHMRWGSNQIGFMDIATAKKILDEVDSENGYCVKFSLRGEPLLYKNISEVLEYASKSNLVDYYFNTNGTLLTEKIIEDCIRTKLPRISISIAGWDKESFERSQFGANFEEVRKNIKLLKEKRNKLNSEYPKIRLQIVLKPEVMDNIEKVKETWKDLGDELGGIEYRDETADENSLNTCDCQQFKCNFLWQRLVVLWNGDVYPCLFHGVKDNRDLFLGNVKYHTLKELWNSDKMNNLRKTHKSGKSNQISSCAKCSYRDSEIEKIISI